jgi:iron(III) transport system ATP-binding protein
MATVGISGLTKIYNDVPVLRSLDLDIADGEFVTLLGPSGCGKTTTLRCIAGLERPDEGRIAIDGRTVVAPAERVFVNPDKRGIGMVFQSYALWPHMTVAKNVGYPLKVQKTPKAELAARVHEALAMVDMDRFGNRSATMLSGGQQQRVALARAIVGNPLVLLFDEPLSNLDAKLRISMRKEIRTAHERIGATSIYVTHDQEEAMALSDRIVVMSEGQIQQIGRPREIYEHPVNSYVADFVGYENVVAGAVESAERDAVMFRPDGAESPIACRTLGETAATGRAEIAIRGDDVRLQRTPPANAGNWLKGTIVSSTYVGQRIEFIFEAGRTRLKSNADVRTAGDGIDHLRAGDEVFAELPVEFVVLLRTLSAPAVAGEPSSEEPVHVGS